MKKQFFILGVVVVLVAAGFISWIAWPRHTANALDFQMYAPTTMPPGLKVTSHEVSEINSEGEHYKALNFATNLKDVAIGEEKYDARQYADLTFQCRPDVLRQICVYPKSPNGTTYIISSDIDQTGKLFSQTISWHNATTRFWVSLQKAQINAYTTKQWGALIDGFKPVDYSHETVQHPTFGP